MRLMDLRKHVCEANQSLVSHHVVIFTWGNVSAIDRESGLVVIKPSGIAYDQLTPENMVIVDMEGNTVDGDYNPSSDTPTHIELYRKLKIGSVVHTHSQWATVFAQAGKGIPPFGTTHADYFYGEIPCSRIMTDEEINGAYEKNTGLVLLELFEESGNAESMPGALVRSHGPFTWGRNTEEAVQNTVVLEYLAMMAFNTLSLNPHTTEISKALLDRHFLRKHGKNAYYGQKK